MGETFDNYSSNRHNALAGNLIAAANASGNQENSSLLTNVQQPLSGSSGSYINQINDTWVSLDNNQRQESHRVSQRNTDQSSTSAIDGISVTNNQINITGSDSNSSGMRMGASEIVASSSNVAPQIGNSSASHPSMSVTTTSQNKVNGSHISIPSSNRPGKSPHKTSSLTNGIINGSNRTSNLSSISTLVNGAHSPSKRKSRESRDNSPVPPTFARQNIKVESPLTDVTLPQLNKEELRRINLRNQNMRQIIYKEVKRPGKNHERLIQMLKKDLHGPSQIRREYVKEVIAEAGRFKRKGLVELLEQQMEEIVTVLSTHQNSL